MYNPLIFDPVNLFTNESVAASTSSAPSTRLETSRMSKVQVRLQNTGPSTNVTVNIYSVDKATGGISAVLQPFNLGAGSAESPYTAWRSIETGAIPRFIYVDIINSDNANVAIISVSLDRWR